MDDEEEEAILGQDIVLREKDILKDLLQLLPNKAQLGFFGLKEKWSNDKSLKRIISAARTSDGLKLEYTCLDVSCKSIAIGCNLGIVFFYTREETKLSRFICENKQVPIVSLKLLEECNFVATAQFSGSITIFKYETERNGLMKVSLKCTVESHHLSPVTSLQWTSDGTKLFTADSEGNVAINVINMDEGKTHTVFICKEDSPVTQLCLCHSALLISTLKRTLVWPFNTKKVVQVGMQERKMYGNFGACFFPPDAKLTSETVDIYAARPGLRLWKASIEGNVCSTMIFKDSINIGEPSIETIDLPSHDNTTTTVEQKQFGPLIVFNQRFLVSWQGSCVWVIDPATGYVIGCHTNLGSVVDVSINENEIFVLSKSDARMLRCVRFEARSLPCIVVEELDLSDPRDIESAQISQFEDQDKLERLLDDVGTRMKVVLGDVKCRVKEIKEQIRSRDGSAEDSDASPMHCNGKIGGGGSPHSTSEDKSSDDGGNSSTEIECSNIEPFGSSYENPPVQAKPFEHLSTEAFPKDIVFATKGVRRKKKTKKKIINSELELTEASTPCEEDDTTTLLNYDVAKTMNSNSEGTFDDGSQLIEQPPIDLSSINVTSKNSTAESPEFYFSLDKQYTDHEPAKVATDKAVDDDKPDSSRDNVVILVVEKDASLPEHLRVETPLLTDRGTTNLPSQLEESNHDSPRMPKVDITKDFKIPVVNKPLEPLARKSASVDLSDMNVVNVKISHQRHGSNVSVQSLGERCKEIRGEALENIAYMATERIAIETDTHRQFDVFNDAPEPIDDCKLYPISPFPTQSIYAQLSVSLSEFSLDHVENSMQEEEIGEYDRIDVQTDLIESIESITDVEDNLSSSPLCSARGRSATGAVPIKRKKLSKNKHSFPSSPCGSDMEGRPLHSPKAASEVVNERLRYLADSWAEADVPSCGQLQSVACSATLLWAVDNHDHVFCTPAEVRSGTQGYVWKRVPGKAVHVACNQRGSVVWCVDRQKVAYYRSGVKEHNPAGGNWEPFEKHIHHVAVDDDCVWAIKCDGDVFVRTGVTSLKPSGSGWITVKVASDFVQVSCLNGLVWALDIYNHVQVFMGDLFVTSSETDSSMWSELPAMNAIHVMLGPKNVCWVIDRDHEVWFNEDICGENPGGGTWYQLSLGEHQLVDAPWFSSVLSFFRKGNEAKMVVANDVAGVLILGKQGTLHVAHGHLLGTRWQSTIPTNVSSSCWTCITAGGADMNKGFVWALQPNGQLYCFRPNGQSYNVHPPNRVVLKYCSTGPRSLWALTGGQDVYFRVGISDACPQGLKWIKVNMQENKRLKSICCGNLVVWAVDYEGNAWLNMSHSEDRRERSFSPHWLPVEECPLDGSMFVKIVVGPDDRVVWACDDRNNVYARKDVSENFWIGTSWVVVAGTSCTDLAISKNHVWGLCPNGDVICRFGVSNSNTIGDYWKKVPGSFEQISVSANDELWGIDRQGHLYERQTLLFYGNTLNSRAPSYNDLFSDHNDWELI